METSRVFEIGVDCALFDVVRCQLAGIPRDLRVTESMCGEVRLVHLPIAGSCKQEGVGRLRTPVCPWIELAVLSQQFAVAHHDLRAAFALGADAHDGRAVLSEVSDKDAWFGFRNTDGPVTFDDTRWFR